VFFDFNQFLNPLLFMISNELPKWSSAIVAARLCNSPREDIYSSTSGGFVTTTLLSTGFALSVVFMVWNDGM